MRCEIVITPGMNSRGTRILRAMAQSAPMAAVVRDHYVGDCELAMFYGVGEPVRQSWFRAHVKSGRHAIAWDLGYWNREGEDQCLRVSVDHEHPHRLFRTEPPERLSQYRVSLRRDCNPDGHIVLVGQGRKTNVAHREGPLEWERAKYAEIRKVYGARRVFFRPKGRLGGIVSGCTTAATGGIEQLLRGAALVVCRHSNVAVDACIAGIPVVCEDGAAAALYGSDLRAPVAPTPAQRLTFLQTVSWWQWSVSEASRGDAWKFLARVLQ